MKFYGYRLFMLVLGLSCAALCIYVLLPGLQVLRDGQIQPAGWDIKGLFLAFAAIGGLMALVSAVSIFRRLGRRSLWPFKWVGIAALWLVMLLISSTLRFFLIGIALMIIALPFRYYGGWQQPFTVESDGTYLWILVILWTVGKDIYDLSEKREEQRRSTQTHSRAEPYAAA